MLAKGVKYLHEPITRQNEKKRNAYTVFFMILPTSNNCNNLIVAVVVAVEYCLASLLGINGHLNDIVIR